MRKGKNVIGTDVLSYIDGKKVHSVKDLIIGGDNKTIVALLVSEGGLFGTAEIVPMENVVSFGKDATMISESNAAIPADSYPAVAAILERKDKLIGKKVFTEGGDEQGSISDVYFEENTGEIYGFEVSGGLVENVQKGTSYLSLEDIVNIGEDVVLIKSEAVYDLDAQVGGIQGAFDTAKDKVGDAAGTAKEKVGDATETLRFRAGQAADSVGQAANQRAESAAIGRRAGADIESDNGRIIVANGQRIRQEHVDEASANGKLAALLASVGLGQAQEAGQGAGARVGDTAGQAADKAGQVAGQAGDKAGSLWDDFTRKMSEMTDSAGKRVDEEKTKKRLSDMQDAVGRPVTKVILDKQDNVILNLGDIITHQAVQQAHEAGMLDSLLESVYKGDVEFSREEMRAPSEGQATVEKASGNAAIVDEMEQKVEQAEQEHEQEREQKRAEAEQKRGEREQERGQHKQERETQMSGGESGRESNSRDSSTRMEGEAHEQAHISDEEFEKGSQRASNNK